jgi:putative transposase
MLCHGCALSPMTTWLTRRFADLLQRIRAEVLPQPMTDILALLQPIAPLISHTTLPQFSRVVFGLFAMTGRVTMLGISRWAGKGGSYRTVQRLYNTLLPWAEIFWAIFRKCLFQPGGNSSGKSIIS